MRISSKTDIGMVRTANEDAYSSGELPGGIAWAVVCDGMGGARGGNIASATAVKCISEQIAYHFRQGMSSGSIKKMLSDSVSYANNQVYNLSQSVNVLQGMGTTVVCVIIAENTAYIAHAGDSRAYLVADNNMTQITKDHSMVQNMVESGQLHPDEANNHPRKNIITRALGVSENIEVDFNQIDLNSKDSILICTDGLTNYLKNDEILSILKTNNFYQYPDLLINKANDNGGGDNITVIMISN